MATYPGSAKAFTTRASGQTIQAAHVNDLQDEVTAIETDLVAGLPVARGGTGQTAKTAGFDALAPGTTEGDLIVHDGTNHVRLAVGTDGYVLTADASATGGVAWAQPGGLVNWAQGTYATELSKAYNSTTWLDTNLSVSITPSAAVNLLVVHVHLPFFTRAGCNTDWQLLQDSTQLVLTTTWGGTAPAPSSYSAGTHGGVLSWTYGVLAGGVAAQTFKVQFRGTPSPAGTANESYSCFANRTAVITVLEYAR